MTDRKKNVNRCFWANPKNPLYIKYHDEEWGRPVHDDRQLLEQLILESFQAGLSWECVLNKREAFREAFDGFDRDAILSYDEKKIDELMACSGIIRNRTICLQYQILLFSRQFRRNSDHLTAIFPAFARSIL